MPGDRAGHSDQTTARVTAKSIEYPTEQLELAGAGWPWRPTALFVLTATAAIGVALVPTAPLGLWWLDAATVDALSLTLIAAVYLGFAVADGRPLVIAVEAGIAAVLVTVAAAGVTGPAWLLVAGLGGHGGKDLWQHRRPFVANRRWWPPFCLVVDWVAAAVLVVLIAVGVDFHH